MSNECPSVDSYCFQCPEEEDEQAALALELDHTKRDRDRAGGKGDDTREKYITYQKSQDLLSS